MSSPVIDLEEQSSSLSPDISDSDSDSTLDDLESRSNFGHPLQRMPTTRFLPLLSSPDGFTLNLAPSKNCFRSVAASSTDSCLSSSSSLVYDHVDFEALVDELISQGLSSSQAGNLVLVEPSSEEARDSVMIKCLPVTSTELLILLELNREEYRQDPWNPAPHILRAIERGDKIFVCMARLIEFDQPPFRSVANYIDFFRQTLEGLTFLHEHGIAQLFCCDPSSLMVDIGPGASSSSAADFDRTRYPVRYYFADFSRATKPSLQNSSSAVLFKRDVQECGILFDSLLEDIPKAGPKLKALVKAMTSGTFGADDARKLFEALCKSLESSVFDIPVSPAIAKAELDTVTLMSSLSLQRERPSLAGAQTC